MNHRKCRTTLITLVICSLVSISVTATAQVSLTGASYFENFDSMSNTATYGTTGWTAIKTAGTSNGRILDTTLVPIVSNGNSSTGGAYNFGTTTADRALGSVASAANSAAFGAVFVNNTGLTITTLSLSFSEEQWRAGSLSTGDAANENWIFQYAPGATAITNAAFDSSSSALASLNLIELFPSDDSNMAIDGNANPHLIAGQITGLSIAPGTTIALRWVDTDNSGSDAGAAVDDFHMTLGLAAVPETHIWSAAVLTFAAFVLVRGRRSAARKARGRGRSPNGPRAAR